jgi:hypothetical protein
MKVECILKREGGSIVEMPGKTYHFAPDEHGRHVADVINEAHLQRFMQISEGYRLVRTPGSEGVEAMFAERERAVVDEGAGVPEVDVSLLVGSNVFPPNVDIDGTVYALGSLVGRAFSDSGLTVENWNEMTADMRDVKIERVIEDIADGIIADVPTLASLPSAPIPLTLPPPGTPPAVEAPPAADEAAKGLPPVEDGQDSAGQGATLENSQALTEEEERAALATQYKTLFGKAPPSTMLLANLRAKVAGKAGE